MIITICGSIAFIDEMIKLKKQLEELGHEVKIPPDKVPGEDGSLMDAREYYLLKKSMPATDHWLWQKHSDRIRAHYDKIEASDAVLIANYDKNGIAHYIGPNTFLEMGLAFYLKQPIYLLNPIPEVPYVEELRGMNPIVISGDFGIIGKSNEITLE